MLKAFFETGSFNQNIAMVIIGTAVATAIIMGTVINLLN